MTWIGKEVVRLVSRVHQRPKTSSARAENTSGESILACLLCRVPGAHPLAALDAQRDQARQLGIWRQEVVYEARALRPRRCRRVHVEHLVLDADWGWRG
jgi:hypothetical protein